MSCASKGPLLMRLIVGDKIHMMDDEYEQIEVDKQIFGDQAKWLVDGLAVNVDHLDSGEPLSGELEI